MKFTVCRSAAVAAHFRGEGNRACAAVEEERRLDRIVRAFEASRREDIASGVHHQSLRDLGSTEVRQDGATGDDGANGAVVGDINASRSIGFRCKDGSWRSHLQHLW